MDAKKTLSDLDQGTAKVARAIPSVFSAFRQMRDSIISDGKLSIKEKELIAVGIAVSIRCHYCVTRHIKNALEVGATRDEIAEAISVAILMGGGSSLTYAAEAMNILDQLSTSE
ncbi:MAG: carboxymuconolactone decarboxylase family protein [Candidatus Methanomethyliaceae archaeon]